MSARVELRDLVRVLIGTRPAAGYCYSVSAADYLRLGEELRRVTGRRHLLAADIGRPNFLLCGIPVVPR